MPTYDGATPTRDATSQYSYTFSGWSPSLSAVTKDVTYTAQFDDSVNYTVTWKNYDGATLEVDNNVPYGDMPTYDGATPTRQDEGVYTYDFAGWDNPISPVTSDVVYTAVFDEEEKYVLLSSIGSYYSSLTQNVGDKGVVRLPHERPDTFYFTPSNFTVEIYTVSFYSSNNSIVKIDPTTGQFECLKEGTVNLTYVYSSVYNTVTYTIPSTIKPALPVIENIVFDNTSKDVVIENDDIATLFVSVSPSDWILGNDSIEFESSNPEIVSIFSQTDTRCVVQGHNIPGTVTITARSVLSGVTAQTTVTVEVTELCFTTNPTVMTPGEVYALRPNIDATFESLTEDILTVDDSGNVTALKAGHGQIKGTAMQNDTTDIMDIYVFDLSFIYPEEEFDLSNYSLIGGSMVGSAYATCAIKVNGIRSETTLDNYGRRQITYNVDMTITKTSGIDGEFKINAFVYDEDGVRMDKVTYNAGFMKVGNTIEKSFRIGCLTKTSYANSDFNNLEQTITLEFDGVAW